MRRRFILYIDFDSTLFDTRRFADDLWRDIASAGGISEEQVRSDSLRFYADTVLGGYDYAAHVASYGLDLEMMWQRLKIIVKNNDYLYPDSPAFIQGLLAKGYEPAILSFGESRFQKMKILPNLPRLVGASEEDAPGQLPVNVVFRKKGEHIAELHPGEQGALVDDVPGQNLPDGFTEIHLNRASRLAAPKKSPNGYIVSDLAQALQTIESISPSHVIAHSDNSS